MKRLRDWLIGSRFSGGRLDGRKLWIRGAVSPVYVWDARGDTYDEYFRLADGRYRFHCTHVHPPFSTVAP